MKISRLFGSRMTALTLIACCTLTFASCSKSEAVESGAGETDVVNESTEATQQVLAPIINGSQSGDDPVPTSGTMVTDNMVNYSDVVDIDLSGYDYNTYVTDFSVYENDDLRELAELYSDNGFIIQDLNIAGLFGCAIGDDQSYFNVGFVATHESDTAGYYDYVMLMNAEQFDEYIVPTYCQEGTRDDDGNVVTIENGYYRVNYVRSTQICILSMRWT